MNKKRKVLVTGGAGYIGSHTVRLLEENSYEVLVLDNLSTGHREAVKKNHLVVGDVADKKLVKKIIREFGPDAVIHFAAFKDATESVNDPKKYFSNNTAKTILFLQYLLEEGVDKFIFSSTAGVYGDVDKVPILETFKTKATNPYSESKLMIEKVLGEYSKAYGLKVTILRYFNAAGADPKGNNGNRNQEAKDVVSMLMKAASGKMPNFCIYGTDYDTRDGTCIRDIIHVNDLATAHLDALEKIFSEGKTGTYNLGSQEGFSVREMILATKKITGVDFEVRKTKRRIGDIVISIASSKKAEKELGWRKKYALDDIIKTSWDWEKRF